MSEKVWNAEGYQDDFGFVHRYGRGVAEWVDPKNGLRLLDLGCGSGQLTRQFSERGFHVIGVDSSREMLQLARQNYPQIPFQQADARSLPFRSEFDTVFSNAVFHWISDEKGQRALLRSIAGALRPGGKLVCEFGGKGCGQAIHAALRSAFERQGHVYRMPFYFPSVGEYAPLLEDAGFRVELAMLFDRPTEMEGEDGLRNWISMFVTQPFEGISETDRAAIVSQAEETLLPSLHHPKGWTIDYVRIRFKATKIA